MGRRKNDAEEASEGVPEWMLTYSDLVTLLLTFFILLFSMANLDKQKFIEVAKSFKTSFLTMSNGQMLDTNQGQTVVKRIEQNIPEDSEDEEVNSSIGSSIVDQQDKKEQQEKLNTVKEQVQKAIIDLQLGDHVRIIDEDDQIILRFDSVLLFDSGSAEVKASGKEVLDKVGSILKQLSNEIMVQGHTDDLPIVTYLYPTNWELSTKRATNVVIHLVKNTGMAPQKLTATGNGEFKPIVPNDSEKNRQKNRRIDIVIKK